jgi:hypothetical protein
MKKWRSTVNLLEPADAKERKKAKKYILAEEN